MLGKRRPKSLLILSASVGRGHVAAARALELAAQKRGLKAVHADLLDFTTAAFRRLYSDAYFELVRTTPELVSFVGELTDRRPAEAKPWSQRVLARLSRVVLRRVPKLVKATQPDVLLHTHFLAPAILASNRDLRLPQAVVVTDYAVHNFWLQPSIARYFVATEDMRVHLEASDVDRARIRVTGIPIGERFARLETKGQVREDLKLPDKDLLLLLASGMSPKILQQLINELKTLKWPCTALIVCGRSEALVALAEREVAEHAGLVDFRVTGYTSEMPRYMAAADLIASKPGGLTTSEALAAGLPFAVIDPYPLQEEANALFLLENGVGLNVAPLTLFAHKVRGFFEDTARREGMRTRALALAKPYAARNIISSLLDEPLQDDMPTG